MKRESGEITPEEQLELSELMKNDEAGEFIAGGLHEVFSSTLTYRSDGRAGSVNRALQSVRSKMKGDEPVKMQGKYRHFKTYFAAASVIFIIALFILYGPEGSPSSGTNSDNIVATKKGSKTTLVLPDGTKVWVNADSKLSYGKDFGGKLREVYLTGEAYFDVAEDKTRPFIVHTSQIDVKVLGTAFNVRAYGDETNTQTTLLRGSVEVMLKKENNRKLLLSPNEKVIVRDQNKSTAVKPEIAGPLPDIEVRKLSVGRFDSLSLETQWTQNRLVFEQEKLEQIVPVLERWYNISIDLKRNDNPHILYRGAFENDSLEDVLESLKMIGNFKYKIQKDKVVIY